MNFYIQLELEFVLVLLNYLILIIMLLISVAFITLMEQKILGGVQIRLGPNKVGYWGLLQPFADAVKLFVKEASIPRTSNLLLFIIIPFLSLFLVLRLWFVFPIKYGGIVFELSLIYFICVRGAGVFPILVAGWSSNSKYSLLGGFRAVAQIISYEVRLVMVLLRLVWIRGSFNFLDLIKNSEWCFGFFIFFPLRIVWFASRLAETNRTPYDFSEGESELVSGFNTEYRAGGFTLIFMAEYARIIFISLLFSLFFLRRSFFLLFLKGFMVSFIFIWVRGTMPRFRYDKLIFLAWKRFLPVSLFALCYYLAI